MWQSMDTAPKDGRFIVARGYYRGDKTKTLPSIIFWDKVDGWCGMTAEQEKIVVKFPPAEWAPIPPLSL